MARFDFCSTIVSEHFPRISADDIYIIFFGGGPYLPFQFCSVLLNVAKGAGFEYFHFVSFYENANLYNCLFQVIKTREALETTLNAVENKVSAINQETEQVESINAINFYKIQNLEKEANHLEEKQKFYRDTIKSLEGKIKDFKENSEIKIDNFTREADKLCERYLSAANKESTESECAKTFDKTRALNSEIEEKEETLFRLKRELEEFVTCERTENPVEASISLEDRQCVVNMLEEQLVNARKMHQNLKNRKRELEAEQCEMSSTHHLGPL